MPGLQGVSLNAPFSDAFSNNTIPSCGEQKRTNWYGINLKQSSIFWVMALDQSFCVIWLFARTTRLRFSSISDIHVGRRSFPAQRSLFYAIVFFLPVSTGQYQADSSGNLCQCSAIWKEVPAFLYFNSVISSLSIRGIFPSGISASARSAFLYIGARLL